MQELLCDLASFIYEHPEMKEKKSYEIFNACPSRHKNGFKEMKNMKRILEYINDLKMIPSEFLADCLEKEKGL